jgi:hypothetical protein
MGEGMQMQEQAPGAAQGQDGDVAEHGGGRSLVGGVATWFHTIKAHPLIGLLIAVIVAVIGFVGEDLYHKYKPWKEDSETFIADLEKRQAAQFEDIKARLDTLRSALPSEGREAFRALESSLADLKAEGSGLVSQLAVAKQENDTLRAALTQAQAKVEGGFDFTLPLNAAFRIDAITTLGLSQVGGRGIRVNLSHPENAVNSRFLETGEGLSYKGADGRACRVTLHTFREQAASFGVSCI